MRGREYFYKYKACINILSLLCKFIPLCVRKILWNLISPVDNIILTGIRYSLLKTMIHQCGDVINIGPLVTIKNFSKLKIGNNVSIHRGCYIDASGEIMIGDDVSIAHNSSLLSTDHSWSNNHIPIRENPIIKKKVTIDNDVWIGCGVRILAGVHIGKRTVVGAGSVVTNNLKGHAVYAGSPAKKIKNIF